MFLITSPFFLTSTVISSGNSFSILNSLFLCLVNHLFPCPGAVTKEGASLSRLTVSFVLAIVLIEGSHLF